VVDLKINFSKYDYSGLITPSIITLCFILFSFPISLYINLGSLLNSLGELKYIFIFLIGICLIIVSYITGLLISNLTYS